MQSLFIVWEYLSIFCFLTKPLESDMENIKPKVKMSHNAKYRCLWFTGFISEGRYVPHYKKTKTVKDENEIPGLF